MWKDNVIYSCFKILLKEQDLALYQESHAILPKGYYITSDNTTKMFDPVVQPFRQMDWTMSETLAIKPTNVEPQNQRIKSIKTQNIREDKLDQSNKEQATS